MTHRTVPIADLVKWMRESGRGRAVIDRVARLNHTGLSEGTTARGIHDKRTIRQCFVMDVVSRSNFEARWGRGSYRRLPRNCFVKMGGRRRAVSGMAMIQGPPRV